MKRAALALLLLCARAQAMTAYRQVAGRDFIKPPAGVDEELLDVLSFWAPLTAGTQGYGMGNATPTQTRATVASYLAPSGLVVKVASGAARFESQGFLSEDARTNLMLRSEALDTVATWATNKASVAADAGPDPFGTITAEAIIEDSTANDLHGIYQGFARTASANEVLSVYAKAAGATWLLLGMTNGGDGGLLGLGEPENGSFETFDLTNGAVGSAINVGSGWTASTATISTVPGVPGLYRCTFRILSGTGTSGSFFVGATTGTSTTAYNGGGSNSLFCSSVQVEQGVIFPTSYIPTTSATVTRNRDTLTFPAGAAGYLPGGAGTFVMTMDFLTGFSNAGGTAGPADRNGSFQNGIAFFGGSGDGNTITFLYNSAGATSANILASPADSWTTVPKTFAGAWATNDFELYSSGAWRGRDLAGSVAGAHSALCSQCNEDLLAAEMGHIRSIMAFAARVPANQIQAFTARAR